MTPLTSGLNIDTGKLNQSTVSYLKARFDKCEQKDKCVSLIMDEVHCKKSVQYVGGKVCGIKDDQVTKTLLCVMVKSVASEYRDIIAMLEVSKNGSNVLHNIWTNVIGTLTEIEFDVAAIITDGHSSNTKFFKEMIKKGDNYYCKQLQKKKNHIFLIHDTVHLFKNIHNNWLTKESFTCPTLDDDRLLHPNLAHLKELYNIELGNAQKLAYKLSHKVLHPQSIDKTNVKLSRSVFHESTVNGLNYYAANGYPYFYRTQQSS